MSRTVVRIFIEMKLWRQRNPLDCQPLLHKMSFNLALRTCKTEPPPGVTPPHRHDEQGCRQGSKLLHSWFESCSNTCGIVGQNLFG